MTGNTDCCDLTVLEFLGIRGLIILLGIVAKVIGIAFIIVIIVGKTGVHASLECFKTHRIRVENILILDFCVVPRLSHMNLIGIRLSILTTL